MLYMLWVLLCFSLTLTLSLCDSVGDGCERVRETGGPRPGQADPFGKHLVSSSKTGVLECSVVLYWSIVL